MTWHSSQQTTLIFFIHTYICLYTYHMRGSRQFFGVGGGGVVGVVSEGSVHVCIQASFTLQPPIVFMP